MIRGSLTFFLVLVGLLASAPSPALALGSGEIRHLLVRTGFAAPFDEVEDLRDLDRAAAVRHLLDRVRKTPVTMPPESARVWHMPNLKNVAERRRLREQVRELKVWWYGEMIATPSPLTERMTLFWHNHFTSAGRVVRHPALMYRQNVLLRRHALGNFGDMLREIGNDPAMMLYLNTVQSHKDAPNENYARELLELFTLGEGNYTEGDIKEVARAYTGWTLNRKTGEARFRERRHDAGDKTIFGQQGNFGSDDVADLLLAHPRAAELIVEKLWRAFISDVPDMDEVGRLAAFFRDADYEILPLMEHLLTSEAFWSAVHRGGLIKSPVDLLVGTVRQFDLPLKEQSVLVGLGRRLGQDILDPPNVKGWPGGTAWIGSNTLLIRNEVMTTVVGDTAMGGGLDAWVGAQSGDFARAQSAMSLLVAAPPVDFAILDRWVTGALVRRLIIDPTYQLK